MPKKGAIILVPFPYTDLSGQKIRPAVVLSSGQGLGDDVIVSFISANVKNPLPEHHVLLNQTLKSFNKTGLKSSSVIKVNKIATLEKKIILGELGKIDDSIEREINKKLQNLFSL